MPEMREKRKRGQRGPGKKTLAIKSLTQPLPLNQSQPEPEDSNLESESISLEVQEHETNPQPEESGFGATVRKAAAAVGLFDDDDEKPVETRGRKSKKANQEEFSTLVVAVLTLGLSFANIPQEIQPNNSELTVFSNHLTGILLRHLPIAKGFSADALDIIGLFAVLSGYYARVSPELKVIRDRAQQQDKQVQPAQSAQSPKVEKAENKTFDPITNISPATGNFLKVASAKAQ